MAVPSSKWFPGTLQDRAAHMQNFSDQMQNVGAGLGFGTAELDRIKDDNTMVQFIASSAVTVNAFASGMVDFRNVMTEGDIGDPTPALPTFSGLVLPTTSSPVETGIWERHIDDVERIRKHPTFTPETAAVLGIEIVQPDAPDTGTLAPAIEVSAAAYGYLFSVVVSGRFDSDMWEVWVARVGTSDWTLAKTSGGKSTDVTIDPGESSGPIQLQVRVQLRRNDANYGQPSQIAQVTINP